MERCTGFCGKLCCNRKAVDKGVSLSSCTGRGVFGVEKHLQELHLLGKRAMLSARMVQRCMIEDMHLVLKSSFFTVCGAANRRAGETAKLGAILL